MSTRDEFENNSESITILVVYDHSTNFSQNIRFYGLNSYKEALESRDALIANNASLSCAFIANSSAEVEYENMVLDDLEIGHEVDKEI